VKTRSAFTLIEIMVSIMIFVIVGGLMLGILLLASDLYRRGEASRSSNDEAVAVLAALDADLSRMVHASDGGMFWAEVHDAAGNCLIAFKTAVRDSTTMTDQGRGARSLVVWWVDGDQLRRAEQPEPVQNPDPIPDADMDVLNNMLSTPAQWPVLTTGCLHFGAALSFSAEERTSLADWRARASNKLLPVDGTPIHHGSSGTDPFPSALLMTVALTGGGRFAAKGFVVSDDGTSIRIAGIKGLPTLPGSMVRIENEWVGYKGYANGIIACPTIAGEPLVGRGQRRTTQAAHPVKAEVLVAQTYSLVRNFGH